VVQRAVERLKALPSDQTFICALTLGWADKPTTSMLLVTAASQAPNVTGLGGVGPGVRPVSTLNASTGRPVPKAIAKRVGVGLLQEPRREKVPGSVKGAKSEAPPQPFTPVESEIWLVVAGGATP